MALIVGTTVNAALYAFWKMLALCTTQVWSTAAMAVAWA